MLIPPPPDNTDDLHLRPSPLRSCICVCVRACVCVVEGLTDEATGGLATRVYVCASMYVCVCSSGGKGENLLSCLYTYMKAESKNGKLSGPFFLALLSDRPCMLRSKSEEFVTYLHGVKKWGNGTSRWYLTLPPPHAADRCVWQQTSPNPLVLSWGSCSLCCTLVWKKRQANKDFSQTVLKMNYYHLVPHIFGFYCWRQTDGGNV